MTHVGCKNRMANWLGVHQRISLSLPKINLLHGNQRFRLLASGEVEVRSDQPGEERIS